MPAYPYRPTYTQSYINPTRPKYPVLGFRIVQVSSYVGCYFGEYLIIRYVDPSGNACLQSFIHPLVHEFLRPFSPSFIRSLIPSSAHPFIHFVFMVIFIPFHSFITYRSPLSFTVIVCSFIPSFVTSSIRSFIPHAFVRTYRAALTAHLTTYRPTCLSACLPPCITTYR